mmetsp:Transcript_16600/g.48120  ORF Transcript_16600/g.48120 Transcript_16600/m.48120 type:complete len:328 (+) Transcript_16600:95-1078(+)
MALETRPPVGGLRLRGTFIDVGDDVSDVDAAASASKRPRARSLPTLRGYLETASIFDESERAYVNDLSDRIGSLWLDAFASSEQPFNAVAVRSFFNHDRTPSTRRETPSGSMLAPDASRAEKGSLDIGGFPLSAEAAIQGSGGNSADAQSGNRALSGCVAGNDADTSKKPSTGDRDNTDQPEICSKPCARPGLPHNADSAIVGAMLDERHLQILCQMPASMAKALMFSILREKVVAMDASADMAKALDRFAKACRVASWAPLVKMRASPEVVSALNAADASTVLASLLGTVVGDGDDETMAHVAAEALSMRLRCGAKPLIANIPASP